MTDRNRSPGSSRQPVRTDGGTTEGPRVEDPEAELLEAGALEETPSGDLQVTSTFNGAWQSEIENVKADEDATRQELVDVMGIDSEGEVELEAVNDAFRITIDGALIGSLESEAAFYADLAAARLLEDRLEAWHELPVADRSRLLKGLRLFLETCPECGTKVVFDTKTVESCCGSYQVAAVDCDGCGSRLFESAPIDEDAMT